jgi:CRP-like cAMP-binding protein
MSDPDVQQRTAALRDALAFAGLDDQAIERLAGPSRSLSVPAGTVVFEKGSPAEGFYVVMSGRVSVVDTIGGHEHELAVIDPGDFFGELGHALHIPRTRAARVREDAVLVEVPREAVQELIRAHPDMARRLLEAFEDRMAGRESAAE